MNLTYQPVIKSKSGEIVFWRYKWYKFFYPENIADNPYIPPIVITDFKILNESVSINEQSILNQSVSEQKFRIIL